jgi:hypothetical protein
MKRKNQLLILLLFQTLFSFSQVNCDTCKVFFSNSLTPDCDQVGCEFLEVVSNCVFKEYQLLIFNRWGEIIFESEQIERKFDSSKVKEGTYLWKIKGVFCENSTFEKNGYLNVFR